MGADAHAGDQDRPAQLSELVEALAAPLYWLRPWACYVLAVLVGTVLGGESMARVSDLTIGIPFAWVVGWIGHRSPRWGAIATFALVCVGLLVGLFQQ